MLMWIRIGVSEPRRFGVGGGGISVRMTLKVGLLGFGSNIGDVSS